MYLAYALLARGGVTLQARSIPQGDLGHESGLGL